MNPEDFFSPYNVFEIFFFTNFKSFGNPLHPPHFWLDHIFKNEKLHYLKNSNEKYKKYIVDFAFIT